MEFCNRCQKQVSTFRHELTTMPQDEDNKVRRYKATICSLCGYGIKSETFDESPNESEKK